MLFSDAKAQRDSRKVQGELFAYATTNGTDMPLRALDPERRVFTPRDKLPFVDSLAAHALRAQMAEQFFETWLVEIRAHYLVERDNPGQPLTPPVSQPPQSKPGTQSSGLLSQLNSQTVQHQ